MHLHPRLNIRSLVAALIGALLLIAALLVGAQNNNDPGVETQASITGQLKTRNFLITIYASPAGPLYTVKDRDGTVLGTKLTDSLLAQRFPVLQSLVHGTADGAVLDRTNVDIYSNLIE